jgi:serine phosphatase RsbU (regulator of sigma subunit)
LIEVQDRNNELYTQDLLVEAVQRRVQLPASQLFDELLEEVKRFSSGNTFPDDVCLVGMEFRGPEQSATP